MMLLAQASAPVADYPAGWIILWTIAGLMALTIVGISMVTIAVISRRKRVCPHCGKRLHA